MCSIQPEETTDRLRMIGDENHIYLPYFDDMRLLQEFLAEKVYVLFAPAVRIYTIQRELRWVHM